MQLPPLALRITDFLIAARVPLLLAALVLSAISWPVAGQIAFDRSIENMFAPDDPLLVPYRQLKQTFGGDEVVVVAYVDPQLLEPEGLERLHQLTTTLEKLPGVRDVLGLDDSPFNRPQWFLGFFEGMAIGADHKTTAVLCRLKPEPDTLAQDGLSRPMIVEQIRAVATRHDASAVVVGEPVMVIDGFDYLERDGRLLAQATTGLLMLVIILFFRSLRWVIIPLAVVQATLLWTQASLVAMDFRLSMVSSMLTAIVTVVGIGTVIHLVIQFRSNREAGLSSKESLRTAGALLMGPILWSCLTDAVGFGALYTSKVGPVKSFGGMTSLGAMLTAVAVAMLVPGLVLLFPRFDPDPKRAWGEHSLEHWLAWLARVVEARPLYVTLAIALITAAGLGGLTMLEVETDFTKNFRENSPIVTSYRFVEDRLGGAGAWDVLIPVPAGQRAPEFVEFLDRVRVLEDRLRTEVLIDPANPETPGLTKVVGLTDALDAVVDAGGPKRLPIRAQIDALKFMVPSFAEAVYAQDPQRPGAQMLRVMLRSREQQSTEIKTRLIDQVTKIVGEEFPATDNVPAAQVTGIFVLLANLIESLMSDQWVSFAVAAGGIFLMLVVALRSLKLAMVAIFPNALPIVVVLGAMGWLGFKVNMGTVMIASVSMGLAVDSSIHYLTAYRRQRAAGKTFAEAIDVVHRSVGLAMVISNLALIIGFSALGLSHFIPTIYFGVLVSLAMLGGLAGNLVLLPLELGWVEPRD